MSSIYTHKGSTSFLRHFTIDAAIAGLEAAFALCPNVSAKFVGFDGRIASDASVVPERMARLPALEDPFTDSCVPFAQLCVRTLTVP
ncbi:MAG: hypothetical protein OXJ37_06820 [Bryobacterales bacterium]|nr:hypothetical protein [Bryobacterales bacterium]MDE0620789.1 hypothetical protein [Bryobacterales bacterium]